MSERDWHPGSKHKDVTIHAIAPDAWLFQRPNSHDVVVGPGYCLVAKGDTKPSDWVSGISDTLAVTPVVAGYVGDAVQPKKRGKKPE